jgi:hypothetical protein
VCPTSERLPDDIADQFWLAVCSIVGAVATGEKARMVNTVEGLRGQFGRDLTDVFAFVRPPTRSEEVTMVVIRLAFWAQQKMSGSYFPADPYEQTLAEVDRFPELRAARWRGCGLDPDTAWVAAMLEPGN